jgi:hypothetical protein
MKKYSILALFIAMITMNSCKKSFIELTNPSAFTEGSYYKTASDLKGGLTAAYSNLQPIYEFWYRWAEITSDNTQGRNDGAAENQIDVFTLGSTYVSIYTSWQAYYKCIASANIVIEKAPAIAMDETLKARYVAEAKVIRALCYFHLVRMFGDVPLITVTIKSPDEALAYNRTSIADVYGQIAKDLTEAEVALPAVYNGALNNEVGRITAIAAKTMLGEVYMTQKKWVEATAKLKEAYNLSATSGVSLMTKFDDIFDPSKNNNQEIIMSVQYQRGRSPIEGSAWSNYFAPIGSGITVVKAGTAYGYNQISPSLNNAFEAGDNRKPISVGAFTSGSTTLYYTRKYIDPNQLAIVDADNDWIVYRYADLLLLYAESLNESGATPDALIQMNKVRARAGLASLSGLNPVDTRLAIERERRVELSCEGHRWFDLVRTGRAQEIMTAHFAAFPVAESTGAAARMVSRNFLFPIPDAERSVNPNLVQNPGY